MEHRPWFASYPEGVPRSLGQYPERSLYSLLENSARRFPDSPAVSFRLPGAPMGMSLTYRELERQVDQFSRVLSSLGIGKGDRVGLILPNCPQYVIAYYACQRLGAVVVGNNPLATERELAHQLSDAGIEVVVVLENLYPTLGAVREEVGIREIVATRVTDFMPFPINRLAPIRMKKEAKHRDEPWPPVPPTARVTWWKDLMARSYPAADPVQVDPMTDLAGLIYTGGTTGLSKGAMLTHFNLVSNTLQCRAWFTGVEEGKEGVMCVIPFFHSYGMTVGMNFGILCAAKLVLEVRFELEAVLKSIQRERPTLFPGVPRLYVAINEAKQTSGYDLSSIKYCLSGAAALPMAVAEKFESITGARLVEGYGLTETSPVTHANPLEGRRKAGSIGLPIPDTDSRVVELEDWTREAPPGEQGELAIAGPQVMRGYFNRPAEADAMIRTAQDGTPWLLTGDIARMDEDGYFYIVDRKKDMVIVSGFNVFPTEVEQVMFRHPAVLKAAVVGVPDDTTGEAVKAYVVLKEGESATAEEIVEFCRSSTQGLAGYKVPKQVEFREALPETLIGKVLRRVLRQEEGRRTGSARQ